MDGLFLGWIGAAVGVAVMGLVLLFGEHKIFFGAKTWHGETTQDLLDGATGFGLFGLCPGFFIGLLAAAISLHRIHKRPDDRKPISPLENE